MSGFYVGQTVVCVLQPAPTSYRESVPVIGAHYVVRTISDYGQYGTGLRVAEISNPAREYRLGVEEPTFHVECFRPVNPHAIEWAHAMCRKATAAKHLAVPKDLE